MLAPRRLCAASASSRQQSEQHRQLLACLKPAGAGYRTSLCKALPPFSSLSFTSSSGGRASTLARQVSISSVLSGSLRWGSRMLIPG